MYTTALFELQVSI